MSASRRKQLKRWFTILCALVMGQRAQAQFTITRHFNVGADIPDAGELVNVQNLGVGIGSIANLKVSLNISGRGEGGWNGDLYAAVGHGTGQAVLLNRPGRRDGRAFGYGDSGLNVTFDDAATHGDIHTYRQTLGGDHTAALNGPLTGAWAPDGRLVNPTQVGLGNNRTALLSNFNGLSADGEWRLFVADLSSGGRHRLESWGVRIETTAAPSGPLTFGNDTIEGKGSAQSLNNPVTLGGSTEVGGSQDLAFNGVIEGSGRLTHAGSGILKLAGNNQFSGGVTVQSGTLVVGNDQALGTGELVLGGGTVQGEGGARQLNNPVRLDGDARFAGNEALRLNGTTTLSGQRTLTVENNTTLAGGITEAAAGSGLVKTGSGTLVLAGANSYSGPTVVSGGRLVVNNASGSATGSGAVTVGSGGLLSGGGIIGGSVTVNSGGTLAPGNSPGVLSSGNTTWAGGASYEWEINDVNAGAGTGWDLLDVTGTLTLTATSGNRFNVLITSLTLGNAAGSVHDFNQAVDYSWRIASASGGLVGFDLEAFHLDRGAFQNPAAGSFSLSTSGNNLYLNYTAVPEPATLALITGLGLTAFVLLRKGRGRRVRVAQGGRA